MKDSCEYLIIISIILRIQKIKKWCSEKKKKIIHLQIGQKLLYSFGFYMHFFNKNLVMMCYFARLQLHTNIRILVIYCSVSLLNGISTFAAYLMPKSSLYKDSNGSISSIATRIRGFIPFPRVLIWKWRWLKSELTYYEATA